MYYSILSKLKNAIRARKESVLIPFTKMDFAVTQVLVARGFLQSADKRTIGKRQHIEMKIAYKNSLPVLTDFKIVSKPSRRLYVGYKELKPVRQNYGMSVISTPRGIMTNRDARKEKVGGEYLFEIW